MSGHGREQNGHEKKCANKNAEFRHKSDELAAGRHQEFSSVNITLYEPAKFHNKVQPVRQEKLFAGTGDKWGGWLPRKILLSFCQPLQL
jgi:hypothetical protein